MLFRFDPTRVRKAHRARTSLSASIAAALAVSAGLASVGGAQDRGLDDWSTSAGECVPSCRDGYECRRGECAPVCSPACGPGLLCTGGGQCVQVESYQAPRPAARTSAGDRCLPACRSGFTCLDGECVSMCNPACPRGEACTAHGECVPDEDVTFDAPMSREPVRDPAPHDPAKNAIVDLHVDALGALQFGVTPTIEVGRRFAGYARLRAINTGVMSYFLLGRDDEDELDWGLGGALGMHVFSAKDGNLRGFFGGPGLEYAFVRTRDTKRDFATYFTHLLVPQADFGYRWGFRSLLVGVGLRLGLTIPVRERAEPRGLLGCRREDSCDADMRVRFFPGVFVDLGYFVPRQ